MVDCRVAAVSRTVKRKGTGLETPNYGSSCKGSIVALSTENILVVFVLPRDGVS